MKYVRFIPIVPEKLGLIETRGSLLVRNWFRVDFEQGSPDLRSVLLPVDKMLPLMNYPVLCIYSYVGKVPGWYLIFG